MVTETEHIFKYMRYLYTVQRKSDEIRYFSSVSQRSKHRPGRIPPTEWSACRTGHYLHNT